MRFESSALAFVMAGGRGSRLKVLTKDTCKPAVNILGTHKIFDFVATNIANTEIPATLVATQFKRESLDTYTDLVEDPATYIIFKNYIEFQGNYYDRFRSDDYSVLVFHNF